MEYKNEMNKLAEKIEKMKNAFQCNICYSKEVDSILVPCGHMLCTDCINEIASRRCPFDRERFTTTVPFYKPTDFL